VNKSRIHGETFHASREGEHMSPFKTLKGKSIGNRLVGRLRDQY
jgi:hypothetical protein